MAIAGNIGGSEFLPRRFVIGHQPGTASAAPCRQCIDQQRLGQQTVHSCVDVAAHGRQVERLQCRKIADAITIAGGDHPRMLTGVHVDGGHPGIRRLRERYAARNGRRAFRLHLHVPEVASQFRILFNDAHQLKRHSWTAHTACLFPDRRRHRSSCHRRSIPGRQ